MISTGPTPAGSTKPSPPAPEPASDATAAEPATDLTAAGTRLTPKGAQTRQRIVVAAAQLMASAGVAQTTMDDVRIAAGVSSSQIYHYFADKQALIRAVIAHQSETIVGDPEALAVRLDTLEGIQAWRDSVVAEHRAKQGRGGCPLGALGSELSEVDGDARADLVMAFDRWEAGIRDGYRAMHARGDLMPVADPDRLAAATLAALQGGMLLAQVRRDVEPLERALDVVLDQVRSMTSLWGGTNALETSNSG